MNLSRMLSAVWAGVALTTAVQGQSQTPTNTPPASGEAPKTRVLNMEDCIRLALEHNLDIQISRYSPLLDLYALNGDYGAYDPSFSFSAIHSLSVSPGRFNSSSGLLAPANEANVDSYTPGISGTLPFGLTYGLGVNDALSEQSGTTIPPTSKYSYNPTLTLSQPILKNFWIDNSRLVISLARKQTQSDEQGLRLRIMTVITTVKTAYYNLIAAREQVRVNTEALELADRLVKENQRRLQVGVLAPLDEKQSESQAASSQADLLASEQSLAQAENNLKSLLTDNFPDWAEVTPLPSERLQTNAVVLNLQESWQKGLAQRPEILEARLAREQKELTARYNQNQVYPEVDLKGSYGRSAVDPTFGSLLTDLRDEQNPSYTYGIVVTIPLGNRSARNALKSAKAAADQFALMLKQEQNTVMVQIDNDVKIVRSNFERTDATHQASQYAEAALDAEQKKLDNGKSTSFIVLQLQQQLTAARSAEIQALANYNISIEQLYLDEGSTLEKNKIDLQVK